MYIPDFSGTADFGSSAAVGSTNQYQDFYIGGDMGGNTKPWWLSAQVGETNVTPYLIAGVAVVGLALWFKSKK